VTYVAIARGNDLRAARTTDRVPRTAADICIYGGAAGGGKTVGLILEPLRHVGRVANFTAAFFRRTTPQITNPGALWDETLSQKICAVTLPAFAEANRYPKTVALASATPRSRSSRKRLRSVFGEQPMILAMSS
jgi:hypothetical protein